MTNLNEPLINITANSWLNHKNGAFIQFGDYLKIWFSSGIPVLIKVTLWRPLHSAYYYLDTDDQIHNRRIKRIGGSLRGFYRDRAAPIQLEEMQSLIPSLMIDQLNTVMDNMLTRKDK